MIRVEGVEQEVCIRRGIYGENKQTHTHIQTCEIKTHLALVPFTAQSTPAATPCTNTGVDQKGKFLQLLRGTSKKKSSLEYFLPPLSR